MTYQSIKAPGFLSAGDVGLPEELLHQSAAVRFGDFCFVSGIKATNNRGVLLDEAIPSSGLPFHASTVELQAKVVLERLAHVMQVLGGTLEHGVYIEQFFTDKRHFEPYRSVGKDYLPQDRPPSTALPCRGLSSTEAVLEVDLTAFVPESGASSRERITSPGSPQVLGSYAQGVRVNDWVFLAGATPADHTQTAAPFPSAVGTAVAPEARVDGNLWYGSPIERQVEYIMTKKQGSLLEAAGSSLDLVVRADVYLSHMEEDLRGFHRVWKNLFGDRAPATTVIPVEGFGSAGSRVEIGIVALRDGSHLELERITVPDLPPTGPYPHAVRAGDLIFVSTLAAVDEEGLVESARPSAASRYSRPQVVDEMEYCLARLEAICEAAGTSLANVLRRKSYFTHLEDLFAADLVLRDAWPTSPPASTNIGITGPHIAPGVRLVMDVIAAVP